MRPPEHSLHHHHHGDGRVPGVIERPDGLSESSLVWTDVGLDFAGRKILDGITCHLVPGEFTCLCGGNGAGKTQLTRLGMGFVRPSRGGIKLFGLTPGSLAVRRGKIGYVPQAKSFNRGFNADVRQFLASALSGHWPLYINRRDDVKINNALDRVAARSLVTKDLTSLSGGELQRVFLARALLLAPELLILDEPLAAVDSKGRSELMALFKELKTGSKTTILMVTHSESVVRELADRVILLKKGRLVGWQKASAFLADSTLRGLAFVGHDHTHEIESSDEHEEH